MSGTWRSAQNAIKKLLFELDKAFRCETTRTPEQIYADVQHFFALLKTHKPQAKKEWQLWRDAVRKMAAYVQLGRNAIDCIVRNVEQPIAALYFSKLPSKRVYHNAKKIGDSMDVCLLLLPGWSYDNAVEITLCTVPENGIQVYGGNQTQTLVHDSATFHDIRLHGGLRMNTARFCARATVSLWHPAWHEGRPATFALRACTTQEFIVVSNTNQWGAAEGILLEKELFATPATLIPWERFIAKVRVEFVRQTRQRYCDSSAAQRLISEATHKMDMAVSTMALAKKLKQKAATAADADKVLSPDMYYHPLHPFDVRCLVEWCKHYVWQPQKKLALAPLSCKDFRTFWHWFGKLVHHIRHNRTLRSLWREGLIPALLTNRMAIETVARQPAGYFVLRFSTSQPNDLVVTYRRQNGAVATTVVEDRPKHGSVDADAILLYLQRQPMLTHMFVQRLPDPHVTFMRKEDVLHQHRLRKCLTSPTAKPEGSKQIVLKRPNNYTLVFLH